MFIVAFVTMIGLLVYKVLSGRKELGGFGLMGLAGIPMVIALGLQAIAGAAIEQRRRTTWIVTSLFVAFLISLVLIR